MNELQIIIDALDKGVKNNIFSKIEIYAIQKSLEVVSEKVQSLEPVPDDKSKE
tara:strand:- start:1179 stop:1337 length:159 start_codon:yes stop_codon:yes gene_type:complete